MKKSLFIGLVAVLGLIGCSRNQEVDVPDANLSIFARTESPAESRTVVESGVHVFWEPGDEIAVFMGEKSAKFTTDITAASGTATFKGTFGDTTWPEDLDLWAVYPFSEDALFDGETITTVLPSEQVAREGSFGKDMNLAIAHSSGTTLQFYNVGGGIRFSVMEEGIKKVMFEGLSGEIISGKVKIGLDDNGKPVVKEVTSGSQFITLLPPSGKEAFEKDTWYYIVAIPGALEGGYKLRFYKESDYARKVSEKAVAIKRSIFGSLEKADEGIEFETTMTHYPETKEEWVESVKMTTSIYQSMNSLFKDVGEADAMADEILNSIYDVEGVLYVSYKPGSSVISVMQKDSVWCNYVLKTQNGFVSSSGEEDKMWAPRKQSSRGFYQFESKSIEQSGNALIYVPFQWSLNKPVPDWESDLEYCLGAGSVKTMGKAGGHDDGGILDLKEALLKHYDLIIIDTHGCVGQTEKALSSDSDQTLLATSTYYSAEMVEVLHKNGITDNQFGNAYIEADEKPYVWFSPDFLGNNQFENSAIILSACSSAQLLDYTDMDDKGSMIGGFINRKAAIVTGAKVEMDSRALEILVSKMIEYLKYGLSFQNAFEYLTPKEGRLDNWLNKLYNHYKLALRIKGTKDNTPFNIPDYYIMTCNEKYPDPFYLFNVNPVLFDYDQNQGDDNKALLWGCALNNFEIEWPTDITLTIQFTDKITTETIDYNIYYDVYVDTNNIISDSPYKTVVYPLTYGPHDWYVVAKIMEGNRVLASYLSDVGHFIIENKTPAEPEAIDLGLSVEWASFNLGATKPEEYGDYFAWGEVEPHYSSLSPLTWKAGMEEGYSWSNYLWSKGSSTTLTKYCTNKYHGYNGFTDNKSLLDYEDDAAYNNGDKWRIPTKAELDELRTKCTSQWTTLNGVKGRLFTGPNGNSIFLPAAGRIENTTFYATGSYGYYTSTSLGTEASFQMSRLSFTTNEVIWGNDYRCVGYSIRPVYGERKTTPSGDIEGIEEDPWN